MRSHIRLSLFVALLGTSTLLGAERWTAEKASAWYASQPWLVGCNFAPSTAINQLEMWQVEYIKGLSRGMTQRP